MYADLNFKYPFWKYQSMILDVVEQQADQDRKYHIVAPPGSGKTIVGLELIRRFGRPAVVFTPTTTIQRQWQEKLALFTEDDPWIAGHSSLDARNLSELTFLTYQVLSTPGDNLEFVERIAVERWVDDLISSDNAQDEEDAQDRIESIRHTNPKAYDREVSKRYRRVKREFLQKSEFDGRQFLHPNARDLIDRIVALGVGTLVLDECHHLLDYWAFILHELIKALGNVRVIGLTATLPDPESRDAYENYISLLGDIDFEVPTPAVVKEGNLAPYRDLVYFCEPSERENHYLRQIDRYFDGAVRRVTDTPSFKEWLWETAILRKPQGIETQAESESFTEFFNREPAICVAAVKFFLSLDRPLPEDVIIVGEMLEPMQFDDWLVVLGTFGLKVLKVSSDEKDQALYKELRRVLLGFGVTLTERGIRHQRSPGELVLSLSESKDQAAVDILRAESKAMGSRLRAVVITDFERMSARSRRLKDVLDRDAGSAVRVFRTLIADPVANALDPVLLTGNVILADADLQQVLDQAVQDWVEEHHATFTWEWDATEDERILQLKGAGKGWGTRSYVSLVTELFERGMTRCLVGTRGLLGEGWDSLALNTLINLTTVTTSTSVRQIRGRSLRLDPNWPKKVAHNWDVVCYSKSFKKGDLDVRRFERRHRHTWGIVVLPTGEDLMYSAFAHASGLEVNPSLQGRVVRGVAHVDLHLNRDLYQGKFKLINFDLYTKRMLRAVSKREKVYDLWKVGEEYSNFTYSASHLNPKDLKFRTVYTIEESLKTMAKRLLISLLSVAGFVWLKGLEGVGETDGASDIFLLWPYFLGLLAAGVIISLLVNARAIWRVFKRAFLELPADAVLLDIGRALLGALRQAGKVSKNLDEKYVRVAETEEGGFQVFLDYASPEDSDTFARAYRELLGPIGDARYLIERDSRSLRNLVYRPLWLVVRTLAGANRELREYHRVPDVLATRREHAEALAYAWKRNVGGGRLIYTRNREGRGLLLEARGMRRKKIKQMAFEFWT